MAYEKGTSKKPPRRAGGAHGEDGVLAREVRRERSEPVISAEMTRTFGAAPVSFTLASLFDGIGGFPLAALRNGITPVWASEIEKFPLAVTALRFPNMRQLGDITTLKGAELPPVDVVTGGSPCQDLVWPESVRGYQVRVPAYLWSRSGSLKK